MDPTKTLLELLAERGFTTRKAVFQSEKHVIRDGVVMFTGDAYMVTTWLKWLARWSS